MREVARKARKRIRLYVTLRVPRHAVVLPLGSRIMSAPAHLHVERHERCLFIRLNRPDKANALSVGLMEDATRALIDAAGDAATGAIVLSGAGERVFSAGADVREQPAEGDMAAHRRRRSAQRV